MRAANLRTVAERDRHLQDVPQLTDIAGPRITQQSLSCFGAQRGRIGGFGFENVADEREGIGAFLGKRTPEFKGK